MTQSIRTTESRDCSLTHGGRNRKRKRLSLSLSSTFHSRMNSLSSTSAGFGIAGFDAIDVEGRQTFASDAIAVLLPLLAALENPRRLGRVLATARLLSASDYVDAGLLLGALASVTIVFVRFPNSKLGPIP